jgi:hypothetical protein
MLLILGEGIDDFYALIASYPENEAYVAKGTCDLSQGRVRGDNNTAENKKILLMHV